MNTLCELKSFYGDQKQSRNKENQEKIILVKRIEDENTDLTVCNSETKTIDKQLKERKLLLINRRITLKELEKQLNQEKELQESIIEEFNRISFQIEEYYKAIEKFSEKEKSELKSQEETKRKVIEIENQLSIIKESFSTMAFFIKRLEDKIQMTIQLCQELEEHVAKCKEEIKLQSSVLSSTTFQRLLYSVQHHRECTYP